MLTLGLLGVAILVSGPLASLAYAQVAAPVITVREHWALHLNEPDNGLESPQFHTVMSPVGNTDGQSFQVTWNYRDYPDFASGGAQLTAWSGEDLQRTRVIREEPLSASAETVRWVQEIEVKENALSFAITYGASTTWGSFASSKEQVSTSLNDLSGYSPEVSVNNSCITYGDNRVEALVLWRVDYVDALGNIVATDNTTRYVFVRN
jgi:hypothetical protein